MEFEASPQADDAAILDLGNAELLGIRDLVEQDSGIGGRLTELLYKPGDSFLDEVVAQIHDELVVG